MGAIPGLLQSAAERLLQLLFQGLLLVIYFLVALPIGLAWRLFNPHPSWTRAGTSRWEPPEEQRDPGSLEQAGKQY